MRVLITGAGGQLGSDLAALLPEAAALNRHELDIADGDAVAAALERHRPDLVFNAAADNAVDAAEADPERAMRVNAAAPGRMAAACARRGLRLVHFSTNYVFDGSASAPYREADRPSPLGAYARSKLEGERQVLEALPSALVIRSSGLFGLRGSAVKGGSFPERIVRRGRAGEPLRVVADQTLNPTYTADLARAAVQLAAVESGVVHLVAEGCCSYWDLAVEAVRQAGLEAVVEPLATDQLPSSAARRPRNGCLASDRVPFLRHWREALAEYSAAVAAAT